MSWRYIFWDNSLRVSSDTSRLMSERLKCLTPRTAWETRIEHNAQVRVEKWCKDLLQSFNIFHILLLFTDLSLGDPAFLAYAILDLSDRYALLQGDKKCT